MVPSECECMCGIALKDGSEAIAPDRRVFVLMELMGGQTRVAVKADQLGIVGA